MDQMLLEEARTFQEQSQQIREQLTFLDSEILSLEKFKEDIEFLAKNEEKEIIASLGKGIHIRSTLKEKDLFVEVGSGVVVKKTPKETCIVIENQISKLNEARKQLLMQLEYYHHSFKKLVEKVQQSHKSEHNHEHNH